MSSKKQCKHIGETIIPGGTQERCVKCGEISSVFGFNNFWRALGQSIRADERRKVLREIKKREGKA